MNQSDDTHYMRIALNLAAQGQMTARPNPCVGCVIVKNDKIVGEGLHWRAGQAHAEVTACLAAGQQAKGATCYVTLEPCVHQGRTGPCVELVIAAGFARVVIAMLDPNPRVCGKGVAALKAAGISATVGVLAQDAQALNLGFISRMQRARPYVRAKIAMSLDGRVALKNGESKWITGEQARMAGHAWRAKSGAVITGKGTVLYDNPRMTARLPTLASDFVQPLRIIVDAHLQVPSTAAIFEVPGVVTATLASSAVKNYPRECVVLPEHKDHVDLKALLAWLNTQEINEVLLEAGPGLTGAFLEYNLIDELLIYIAPKLLGGEGRAMMTFAPLKKLSDAICGVFSSMCKLGEDLHIVVKMSDFAKGVEHA